MRASKRESAVRVPKTGERFFKGSLATSPLPFHPRSRLLPMQDATHHRIVRLVGAIISLHVPKKAGRVSKEAEPGSPPSPPTPAPPFFLYYKKMYSEGRKVK